MRTSKKPLRVTCLSLLGATLLLAEAPLTQAPAATTYRPTVNAISGPADSMVCALLGGGSAPDAMHGRIAGMHRQNALSSCGSEGASLALPTQPQLTGAGIDAHHALAQNFARH